MTSALQKLAEQALLVDVEIPHVDELLNDALGGHLMLMHDFKWDIQDYLSTHVNAPVATLAQIIDSGACHPALRERLLQSEATRTKNNDAYQYAKAQRSKIRAALQSAMADHNVEVLVYPSIKCLPVALGEWEQPGSNCSYSARSGLPALALPAGFSPSGIPVGMELLGPAWSEPQLLQLGAAIERKLNVRRAPDLG